MYPYPSGGGGFLGLVKPVNPLTIKKSDPIITSLL